MEQETTEQPQAAEKAPSGQVEPQPNRKWRRRMEAEERLAVGRERAKLNERNQRAQKLRKKKR